MYSVLASLHRRTALAMGRSPQVRRPRHRGVSRGSSLPCAVRPPTRMSARARQRLLCRHGVRARLAAGDAGGRARTAASNRSAIATVDRLNELGKLVLRPFGIPPAREVGHAPHSEDELFELLAEGGEDDPTDGDRVPPRRRRSRAGGASRHGVRADAITGVRQRGLDAPIGLVQAHELLAAALGEATVELGRSFARSRACARALSYPPLLRRMRDERREMVLVPGSHAATVGS